jgi:two-component system nitrogen regulation sensor histidine kinase GlnL
VPDAATGSLPAWLADNLSTGLVLLDEGLRVVYLNPAAEQLLGVSRQRLQGEVIDVAVPSLASLRPFLQRAIDNGEAFARRELTLHIPLPGSEPAVIDCTVSEWGEFGGGGLVMELTDASRRLRISRESALLSQLDVGRTIVRQLAHEIRNPLGGLRGAAQLLHKRLPDEALREYTRIIIREADRLAGLATNMMGPGTPPAPERLNIHEIVEHVYTLARAESPDTLSIERDYDPSLPLVKVDRAQVIQAMLNLARNAMQVLGDEGRIVFRTRALTHYTIGTRQHRVVACVEIEDDGPGVPESLRESLFYPLITGRPGGTGLGLGLAQNLVNRQGGLIEYTSRAGRTVFQMLFPLEEADVGHTA